MTSRLMILAAAAVALCPAWPMASKAEPARPPADALPVPPGYTKEQVLLGDRIFHGEAASGQCSYCHGWDAKGTPTGNDLTSGLFLWGDGSVKAIRRTITHNNAIAPGVDGELTPADIDAVAAYVWSISHRKS
ncbi:MAG: c-type cytochrome [Rhodomicrobium sp.]